MARRLGRSQYSPGQVRAISEQILRQFAQENGLPESFVTHALAIEAHESGGFIDDALNDGSAFGTNEYSVGPWQINLKAHPNVTVEQAMDPAFATRHRLSSLLSAWNKLGGDRAAQADPIGFQSKFHSTAQVSFVPTAKMASDALAMVRSVPADGGVQAGGAPTATRRVFPVQGYQGNVDLHWGEHTGATDIFAEMGTPVLAMAGGTVESVGSEGAGGNNVTVRGDDGNLYYYAHMIAPPTVKQGQRIEAGTHLGGVGDTGNAKGTGPHLHIGIGPSIARGVGPAGGAGEGFDAVNLLRETLGGGSTYVGTTTGSAGGPQMATMPQFTYTSPYQGQIAALQTKRQKAQERLAQLEQGGVTREEAVETGPLMESLAGYDAQLIDLIKIDQQEREFAYKQHQDTVGAQANAATGIAGLRQQGFENQAGTAKAIADIINTAFGQRLDLAGILNTINEGNRAARLQELNTMIAMGELDMAQAAMRFDVQERQQAAELAWVAQAANKAGWIADEERKNALMFLPEGTHFQPGFEPNGAVNATFAKWGIPPMVIGVAEVDRSRFDPENNLRRGAAIQGELGAPLPNFDTAETTAAADRVRGIAGTDVSLPRISASELNLPAPTNAEALIGNLPQNPDMSDIEAYLAGLMNPDVGIPSSVSAGTPPPPGPNPTNAPLGPSATGFITAEAAAHRDPARATVAAAATPAGLARRDAGLPVGDQNVMTPAERVISPGTALIANQANANNAVRGPTKPLDDDDGVADTIWRWLTKKRKVPGFARGGVSF